MGVSRDQSVHDATDDPVDDTKRSTSNGETTRYGGSVNVVSRSHTDRREGSWVTFDRELRGTDTKRTVIHGYPDEGSEAEIASVWVDRYSEPFFEDGAGVDGKPRLDVRPLDERW